VVTATKQTKQRTNDEQHGKQQLSCQQIFYRVVQKRKPHLLNNKIVLKSAN